MTKYVKKSAKETISMLGGDCCNPIACRKMASTVTMNGKLVTIIAIPGTRLRTVMSAKSCTDRVVNDPVSPSESETS
jgi:hypothetical protein